MPEILPRDATRRLEHYAQSFRVVIVNGPRQAGKTTLLRLHQRSGGDFRSLDEVFMLRAALRDPLAFVREGRRPLHIDEVQVAGDALVRAIKLVVDEDWTPGQFILSGSTRFLTVPTLSESLAGRAVLIDLWPLSMAERTDEDRNFVDRVFSGRPAEVGTESPWSRPDYLRTVCEGGYPEVIRLSSTTDRGTWFDSYVDTVVQRDVREFAHGYRMQALPNLLALVSARAGSALVLADLARSLGGITPDTVRTYLSYLETLFLIGYAPAWSTNLTTKIARTAKAFPTDSGLAAHLLHVTPEALAEPGHPALGGLVETFVFNELTKAASFAETPVTISHFRERDGREVDFVLESRDGRVVAIEVKASTSPPGDSTRHLTWLRDRLGERFVAGIMLYMGTHALSWGDRILALPLSTMWGDRLSGSSHRSLTKA